jgi:hypothetical protein
LKQATTILLALLIFLQPFSKMVILVSFKINQKEIAKTLCVKKEVQNNTCQGRCHLKKQLDKAEEQEKKQAPATQKEKVETLYCQKQTPFDFLNSRGLQENKLLNTYKCNFRAASYLTDIFHPPESNLI